MTSMVCMTHLGEAAFAGDIQTLTRNTAQWLLFYNPEVPIFAHMMSGKWKGHDVQIGPYSNLTDNLHRHVQFYYTLSMYNIPMILKG